MISQHRQSQISFWVLAGVGVIVVSAAGILVSAATKQIIAVMHQPACGCGVVTYSKSLLAGGAVGAILLGWIGVVAFLLIRQTREFIHRLVVTKKTAEYRVINESKAIAFTAGLLRPQIYLSTGLLKTLTDKERRAVIRHERFHRDRHDPLRIAITETLQRTLKWIPGVLQLYHHWRLTRELAADATNTSSQQRQALGTSLVKLLEQPLIPTAVSAFSATEARVRELVAPSQTVTRRQWFIPIVAVVFIAVAAIGLSIRAHTASAGAPVGSSMCPLTRQCLIERAQQRSVEPLYVVCSPFSPAGGCFIVDR